MIMTMILMIVIWKKSHRPPFSFSSFLSSQFTWLCFHACITIYVHAATVDLLFTVCARGNKFVRTDVIAQDKTKLHRRISSKGSRDGGAKSCNRYARSECITVSSYLSVTHIAAPHSTSTAGWAECSGDAAAKSILCIERTSSPEQQCSVGFVVVQKAACALRRQYATPGFADNAYMNGNQRTGPGTCCLSLAVRAPASELLLPSVDYWRCPLSDEKGQNVCGFSGHL